MSVIQTQASLYIHIPFCSNFCDYCDFYSIQANPSLTTTYINALIADIKHQIEFFSVKKIPTVYIGGGTPSVLGEKISLLFDALKRLPCFSPVEFTIEVNPESLTEEFLKACLTGGVNRLSVGVQTFHEPSRIAVNRIHWNTDLPVTRIEDKLALASRYFPDAVSVDLITGLPFHDEKIIIKDINKVLEFNPAHISLYSLSVENGTLLEEKLKAKTVTLPDSDKADSFWLTGRDTLLKAGFEHYEVSNFALPGKRCLHNMSYWQMDGWLAIGPSASGTIINEETACIKRFTFAPDINAYIKTPSVLNANREEPDRFAFLKESLLMGFRCKDGPCPEKFYRRFGITVKDCIGKTLMRWEGRDKMLFLNQFLLEAFEELDKGADLNLHFLRKSLRSHL
jgi:oxygen-independent coproporphyrinogen-3 oxidase